MRAGPHVLVLVLALSGEAATQEEQREEILSVKVICEKWGDEAPRYPKKRDYYLIDHRIRWEVGPTPIGTVNRLEAELKRIYSNKRTWQPDRENPGRIKPMPIVIEPGPTVCWHDFVQTHAAVAGAGFREIRIPRGGQVRLVAERVAGEQVPAGILVPAVAEARAASPWTWRVELQITQRGVLKQGDTTVYDPQRDENDRSAVVPFLKSLRDQARQEGQVVHEEVDGEVREVLARPILLHVDKWTELHYVERLLEDCLRAEPPFRVVRIAVTEHDQEERILSERRK